MRRSLLLAIWLLTLLIVAGCSLLDNTDDPADDDREDTSASTGTGTIIINMDTVPAGQAGSFTVTGVPTGTLTTDGTLVGDDLAPGMVRTPPPRSTLPRIST